jgi:hypothetical protein
MSVGWIEPPVRWYRPVHTDHNGLVRGFQSRHWGWWYLSIGLGFLLLAMVYLLRGAGLAPIALRVVVAVGFVLLGWMQFRFGR